MDPYITFFIEHWALSSALVAIIVLFLLNEWRTRSFGVANITVQQLVNFLNHDEALVIDIRANPLFQGGHILGAMNLPKEEIMGRLTSLQKYQSKPVVLVCTTGLDAPKIARELKGKGFTQIYCLAGGMESWHAQSMPVMKGSTK